MRKLTQILTAIIIGGLLIVKAQAHEIWVTAYYTGWRQDRLKPEDIDFHAITHLVHFSVVPRQDGTLDTAVNMLTPANIKAVVLAAHDAGKKVLFTVGGQDTRTQFEGAISKKHRKAFIAALVSFLRDNSYDGIDIDMEDILPRDNHDYTRFIQELRTQLNNFTPRPLLTAAVLWNPRLFSKLAANFDQINLMTYNLSGPYPGWVVWHSGSLYDGGQKFPNEQVKLPSVDGLVETFLAAGVPRSKLGIGLSFNGYVWSGGAVSQPLQEWKVIPVIKNVPYSSLAKTYHIKEYDKSSPGYHWDAQAQAAYLSIKGANPSESQFVSYDNEVTARKMIQYVRRKKIGGLIVWDIGAGYRVEQAPDHRDILLQAVKQARLASTESAP